MTESPLIVSLHYGDPPCQDLNPNKASAGLVARAIKNLSLEGTLHHMFPGRVNA